ncbi:MAG TPA: sulfotransferase [Fimbriimonadaceae bacterium]|jgi:tetratricopeptide (TPR) repeat protein
MSDLDSLLSQALSLKQQGRADLAAELLANSKQKDKSPEAMNLFGICLISMGRAAEAESAFRSLLANGSNEAPVHQNLGLALRMQNKSHEALQEFQTALVLDPREQNFLQVFKQLQHLSLWNEAVANLQSGLAAHPDSLRLAEALAITYGRLNRIQEAEELFKRIYAKGPSNANAHATWLQEQGRFQDSVPILYESLKMVPEQGVPYRLLAEAKHYSFDQDSAMALAYSVKLNASERMNLAYALGRLFESRKAFKDSMEWFDRANDLAYGIYPSSKTFNAEWVHREPGLAASIYTKKDLEQWAPFGSTDERPVFIVGMIRSGTTLLDQIVSSHAQVVAIGESPFWTAEGDAIHSKWLASGPDQIDIDKISKRYIQSIRSLEEYERFTDKMPLNFRHLGLINIAFPNAKILHIRRDPFDACLSIYTTFFSGGPNFAYRKENIVAFYRSYLAFMEHWRQVLPAKTFMELDYESLVTEPEPITREIITFLGLPWDKACLSPQSNTSQVSTPSRWQARQPVYTTSIGKKEIFGQFIPEFLNI